MTSYIEIHLLLVLSTLTRSQFFTIDNPPRSVDYAACATYNHSIFIMGGTSVWQLVEYNILSNVVIDYGQTALDQKTHGISMYYSQYGDSLFFLEWDTREIYVYDLSSPLFPSNTAITVIQKDASNILGASACVATSEHFLFVVGGWEGSNLGTLNILSLPDHVWSLGPEMINSRVDLGCVVMRNDYLYAIAGGRAENERIPIHNAQNQPWQSIESLTEIVSYHGIARYEDVIWVFGGRDPFTSPVVYFDKIWNIYTKDGSVALLSESLPFVFSLRKGTMTIVDDTVYLFGNRSLKYVIPSDNPTATPTDHPSGEPSFNPTKLPSDIPSKWPSNAPTDTPELETTLQKHTEHRASEPSISIGAAGITVIIIGVCVLIVCVRMVVLLCRLVRVSVEKDKKSMVKEKSMESKRNGDVVVSAICKEPGAADHDATEESGDMVDSLHCQNV